MASILIVGSGALANAFAANLCQNKNHTIQLFCEWQTGVDAIQQNGIQLSQAGTTLQTPSLPATTRVESVHRADLILFLVKSWQTRRLAEQVSTKLRPDGVCITLQNGLGNDEILRECFGEEKVNAGTTTLGATLIGPGRVQVHFQGNILLNQHISNAWTLPLFRAGGFSIDAAANLDAVLWGKLVINAIINPLTALLRIPNGALAYDPHCMALMDAMIDEIMSLVKLKNISLPYPDAHQRVREMITQSAQNHSSMYQDIQRNAPTEIENITGAILQEAARYDLDMPVNQTIYRLLKTSISIKKESGIE